ncbi:acetoacetate--CoA ligase [Bradyrhizobium sp. YCK136]|uniref:Acetoacetyl-CoA synthetase n=1 Tax=Bradyrhizobium diazoefficiens TaxID=1355477 RepID=A0A0E4FYI8_9BRAD|nr:acetoacetate--CoA ligase [Bradyrhizobium diazoefficiens]MBR0865399.1 acetoacetate--CoA ligase [Bradyrhizobium diazoefficiens]MBR0889828.1 acetoacetate--CoA ligase [Bradyrhizobium diazoefficiens]MBR0921536.1 acetoacetate--CoA ligase [Bradyrhizobium diazoefficiens]BAR62081.1 acetoacetyl-CoA synthetase [Bradyrhizobium diazoefficiens]
MTAPFVPQIALYRNWLAEQRGLTFGSYEDMRQWSVRDLDGFWRSIWDYYDLQSPTPFAAVITERKMPGAVWFPGAQVNYARQVFRHVEAADAAGLPAIVSGGEDGRLRETSWPELRRKAAALSLHLKDNGIKPGDRVAAYLPNIPETIIAFLATASIGAVWSVCAPDMAAPAVIDRFKQIEPKVLIACDAVTYAGRRHDRRDVVAELRRSLPTVAHVILHSEAGAPAAPDALLSDIVAGTSAAIDAFEPAWLPFDHPLWIVYSSGTTGLPKPIVHGHGGIVIVVLALLGLHNDIGCSYHQNSFGERYHWYSSTGWIMWNSQVGGLLGGTTCCIFDGSPGGAKDKPDWTTLWRFVAQSKATFFGAGAAFFANCAKAEIDLAAAGDLSRLRCLGSTGSPLSADTQAWFNDRFAALSKTNGSKAQADIWWANISGGTDFAGAFIGGNRQLPQTPGAMQCRLLGAAVEAFSEQGRAVTDEVGELVCTEPMPSMPLYFWNDKDGVRYRSSYFETYPDNFDGSGRGPVWRHGDWLKVNPDGSCIIYGRSDATINRHGLRMGTSELYSAIETLPEVLDSLVVDLEYLGRDSYMPLFVVLREGVALDAAMQEKINKAIEAGLSRRFLPNEIFAVAEIPRTLSGKKQELPIKKLLLGQPVEKVINKEAMANPGCLDWYLAFARDYLARRAA